MRISMRSRLAAAVGCVLAGSGAASAQAAPPKLDELVGSAQLVVQTRVSKVEYRMSSGAGVNQPPLPYTIVTYRVVKPLRGGAAMPSLTLRFIGGPDGRGNFIEASHVPTFQVGDEDILFVKGNGAEGCPLVDCIDGRFRVLDGVVHDGRGTPVATISGNAVVARGEMPEAFRTVRFPAPSFDQLMKNAGAQAMLQSRGMSVEEARRRYEANAPRTVVMTTVLSSDAAADHAGRPARRAARGSAAEQAPVSVDGFVAALAAVATPASRSATLFSSASGNTQIAAPTPRAVAPGLPMPSARAAQVRSPADLAEEAGLPQDDPSITRHKTP